MSQIFLCGIFISPNKSNKNEGNNNARQALQDEEKRAEERQRQRGGEREQNINILMLLNGLKIIVDFVELHKRYIGGIQTQISSHTHTYIYVCIYIRVSCMGTIERAID